MRNNKTRAVLNKLLLGALLLPALSVMAVAQSAAPASASAAGAVLMIKGAVKQEISLSLADLKSLPRAKFSAKGHDGAMHEYEGVSLQTLLAKAGVPAASDLKGKSMALFVIAEGGRRLPRSVFASRTGHGLRRRIRPGCRYCRRQGSGCRPRPPPPRRPRRQAPGPLGSHAEINRRCNRLLDRSVTFCQSPTLWPKSWSRYLTLAILACRICRAMLSSPEMFMLRKSRTPGCRRLVTSSPLSVTACVCGGPFIGEPASFLGS